MEFHGAEVFSAEGLLGNLRYAGEYNYDDLCALVGEEFIEDTKGLELHCLMVIRSVGGRARLHPRPIQATCPYTSAAGRDRMS